MKQLDIVDLHVETKDRVKILKGVSLTIRSGEVHALMGPNGGGKSTLAASLMGHPEYIVTKGSMVLDGTNITSLQPDQRSRLGLFLGFQYPVEIPGVNYARFLRQAVNANLPEGAKKMSPVAFRKELRKQAQALGFSEDLTERALNEGFSGGEKKKAEVLQMAMLKPKYAVLDEPDSGLDVDALRYIAKGIASIEHPIGLLLVTHYQRILSHISPDSVHVIKDGVIVQSGDAALAHEIEKSGYEAL